MSNFISDFYNNIRKICQHLQKKDIACSVEASYDNEDFICFNLYFLEDEGFIRIEFPIEVIKNYSSNQVIEYLKDRYNHNIMVESDNTTTNTIH